MNWLNRILVFLPNMMSADGLRFTEETRAALGRYLVDTGNSEQTIEEVPVVAASSVLIPFLLTIHADNGPLTQFRAASFNDNSLMPWEVAGGFAVSCCWPETLINDLESDPKPEWLEGVEIINPTDD